MTHNIYALIKKMKRLPHVFLSKKKKRKEKRRPFSHFLKKKKNGEHETTQVIDFSNSHAWLDIGKI